MNLKQAYKIYETARRNEMLRVVSSSDNQICKVCKTIIMCDMCKRFGKEEGEKWMRQSKKYLNE